MKTRNLLLLTVLTSLALPIASRAGDVIKANNTTALNLAGSWASGTPIPPDNTSVAVWDSTVTAYNSSPLGADQPWQGIKISNVGGAANPFATTAGIQIQNASSANTLTLGTAGIDMSTANQALLIQSKITLAGNQTWNIKNANTQNAPFLGSGINSSLSEDLMFAAQANATINLGGFALGTTGAGSIGVSSGYTISNGTLNLTNANTWLQSGGSRAAVLASTLSVNVATNSNLRLRANSGGLNSAAPISVSGTGSKLQLEINNGTVSLIQSGKLTLGNGSTLEAILSAAGVFTLSGEVATSGSVSWLVNGGNANAAGIALSGALTGNGTNAYQNTATVANGQVRMSGDNSAFTGTVNLNGASGNRNLRLIAATAGSASATWTVGSGNTLEVDGVAVNLGTLNGAGTVSNSHASVAATITVGAGSFSGVIGNGAVASGMALTKNGGGTLTLSGSNNYTGATTVSGGSLLVNSPGSLPAATAVAVNTGTLGGSGSVGAVTVPDGTGGIVQNGTDSSLFTIASLTYQGDGALNIVESSGAAGSARVVVTGALTTTPASGTITVNGSGTWANGANVLLSWGSGSPSLTDFTVGTMSGLTARQALNSPALSIVGNTLVLTVNGDAPKWTGLDSGNWVVGSTGANGNWAFITAGTPTDYIDGDVTLFDDTAAGSTTLNISANIAPAAVTFNNSTLAYSVAGAAINGTATLVKNGTAALTVANANGFSGGVQLNAGTLNVNNANALGSGTLTIAGSTTLDNTSAGAVTVTNAQTWGGDFAFTGTRDLTLGAAALNANRQVTVNGGTLAVSGVSGTGFNLTKAGAGTLTIGASSYTGVTTNNGGTLKAASTTSFNTTASITLTNAAGVALDLNGNSQTIGTITGGGASGGNILLNGATLTTGTAADNTFSGALIGSSSLVKNGNGKLTLAGDKTGYTGATTVNAGTLDLDVINGTFGPAVTVTGGAANNSIIVGGGLFVQGNGTLNTGISGGSAGFGARGGNLTVNVGGAGATINFNSAGSGGLGGFIFGSPTSDSKVIVQNNMDINNFNGSRDITVNTGTGTASAEISGIIFQNTIANINKKGSGDLILSGTNTYSGETAISAGRIVLGHNLALQNSPINTTNAGRIDATGFTTPTFGGLKGTNDLSTLINAGYSGITTLTLNTVNTDAALTNAGKTLTTFSGAITDGATGMNVVKTGVGTQTLSGTNTYTGNTIISAGTLALTNSGSIANTANIVVASNAIFNVSGLTLPFALGASQTLSNSAPGAIINGVNNCSVGSVSLVFDGTNPSIIITNGTMTLSASTVIKVSKTGATLQPGTYKSISKATAGSAGLVAGGVTAPVVVGGSGSSSAASLQIVSGELYLNVGVSTLALVSSAQTNGYHDSVDFIATVQTNSAAASDATGTVTFSYTNLLTGVTPVPFSTNSIVSAGSVTSLAITNLSRGTNWIKAIYSGDANYTASTNTLAQVVTNHPPVVQDIAMGALSGVPASVTIIHGKYAPTDVDGDALLVTAVANPSVQSGVVTTDGTNITYTAANSYAGGDSFNYTVSDSFGGVVIKTVTVNVTPAGTGYNLVVPPSLVNGEDVMRFVGIPGCNYALDWRTNLSQPVWVPVVTNTAAANGFLNLTNATPDSTQNYYRTRYVP